MRGFIPVYTSGIPRGGVYWRIRRAITSANALMPVMSSNGATSLRSYQKATSSSHIHAESITTSSLSRFASLEALCPHRPWPVRKFSGSYPHVCSSRTGPRVHSQCYEQIGSTIACSIGIRTRPHGPIVNRLTRPTQRAERHITWL
jgi:hypothetical protein